MGNESTDHWERELALEHELRTKLYELRQDESDAGKKSRGKASREWFAQVHKVLDQWIRTPTETRLPYRPPDEVLIILCNIADDLSRGLLREPLTDIIEHGRNPMDQVEENDIGYATAYLQAVEDGKINDRSPVKTITDAYGVKRQTAQRWKKKKVPDAIVELVRDLDVLMDKVRSRGKFYRMAGRSSEAIQRRDQKRK